MRLLEGRDCRYEKTQAKRRRIANRRMAMAWLNAKVREAKAKLWKELDSD